MLFVLIEVTRDSIRCSILADDQQSMLRRTMGELLHILPAIG